MIISAAMKHKSSHIILRLITLSLFTIMFCGCGGSTTDGSDFVYTGANAPTGSGSLLFNFVQAQAPLEVPAETTQIRFNFFQGPDGTGTLLQQEVRDFAATITIEPVDLRARSVVVSPLAADGSVLLAASANFELVPGQTVPVDFSAAQIQLPALAGLQVSPDGDTIVESGTIAFTVAGTDQFGQPFTVDPSSVTWSIASGTAATIDPSTGVATGVEPGVALVAANVGSVSDTASLNVIALGDLTGLTSVTPSPVNLDLDVGNDSTVLTTVGVYQNNPAKVLNNADDGLTYTITGAPGVATVSNSGIVTALAQGSTQITAAAGPFFLLVDVNVSFGAAGNVAPTVTLDAAPLQTTLGAQFQAFPGATVTDSTQASFTGGTLTVEANNTGNQDVAITLPTNPAIGAIQNNGMATVTVDLDEQSTPAQVQAVLQNTTIVVNSDGDGQLEVTVDDGLGLSGSDTRDFTVFGLTLVSGPHTFDTDTGELDGSVHPDWNGTALMPALFDVLAGATLTVSGSQPFQVDSTGDILITGIIDAGGRNAGNVTTGNANGTAGGLGGPGGFAGGRGGGDNFGDTDGVAGGGPGGGGGGMSGTPGSAAVQAGGGGAGHLNVGTIGERAGNGVAGAAGVAYASIPGMLLGGSGGGGGSIDDDGAGLNAADDGGAGGGGGGGAVRMTATGTITVDGTIDCSGGDGGDNTFNVAVGGAGGAGSGGSIELLAPTSPTVNGTLDVTAGVAGRHHTTGDGGAGSVGRTIVGTI
jgi:hypothetical protein